MNCKPIIIVLGEPNSIFTEILSKTFEKKTFKSPIIVIGSFKLINMQLIKLKRKIKINLINYKNLQSNNLSKNKINLININYNVKVPFEKISNKSNLYIKKCFDMALKLLKNKLTNKFINGPISKKFFLKRKYNGITEYLSKKTHTKNFAMLIFNKKFSVCPITTHLPIKMVSKNIDKKTIINKIKLIDKFFKLKLKKKAKIAVTGLNPHCESKLKFKEDDKIIKPAIKNLKKLGLNINGPFSADTLFIKDNRKNYDVIVGMYHDQVLTPMKTLFEYDAINITLGLPFFRVSPDHGPNENMLGKNFSNPKSLIRSIEFLDN